MKIDIIMKALLKTLFIWAVTIVVVSIGGGVIVYGIMLLANFIVSHNLSLIILVPVCCAIVTIFGFHVNYNYKEMLK